MAFFKLPERKRKRVGAERGRMKRERDNAGQGKEESECDFIYLKCRINAGSWDFTK